MKFLTISFIFLLTLAACTRSERSKNSDQHRMDSLERKLNEIYKPGLGEFMSGIQVHHAKLWFAGQNKNWKLADFEVNEMEEALSGIKTYCDDRTEAREVVMIDQPMDSLKRAIEQKDFQRFKKSYIQLTNTCNSCHQVTGHEFNVIKIPDHPPFSNQDFKVK